MKFIWTIKNMLSCKNVEKDKYFINKLIRQ